MPERRIIWTAKVQGMDWEACSICETCAVVTATTKEQAIIQMEEHANTMQAIVVPDSLRGPYSRDEFVYVREEIGRYLPDDEAKKAKELLVVKGFLKP